MVFRATNPSTTTLPPPDFPPNFFTSNDAMDDFDSRLDRILDKWFDRILERTEKRLATPTPTTCSTECPSRDTTTSTSAFTIDMTPTSAVAIVDVVHVLAAPAASDGTLHGDTISGAASTPTACSTGGIVGDDPGTVFLIPRSVASSFTEPPELSRAQLGLDNLAPVACSMKCLVDTNATPSRLLQAAAPALTHELMVLRPMPWPSFECSQVWTSLVNYGIPVSFQDVLQITPAMGDVQLRLSGLPPRRQYLLQIASMSRNAEVQSTTKHLRQPVHLLPHDTYVMKHFSSARNSLREALRYLQSVQLKLPWPSFSNTCRAVQVHWKSSEHQVQEHAAVCSIPTPDHQPRMKSKLQEMLHPAPLQIFLISSVEQQPWPSGHFTFLISTELSDCCSETIHPCVDAGSKRMELSTQSAFLCSSEQFLLEIAWPLSFEKNTTTGRPYCMHNSQPPFGEIRPWFSTRIWGWTLHLLGSVKTSSVTQHVTCNMVCLQLQRFGLLAIHLIDGISLSSYQYTATGDTWMEVLLQPMEGAEYFVHHGASYDVYLEKFTLERKLEIKLFQLVRVHCKDRWSLWADREILEFNHAISRIHRTSIIGSLLHREFCQRTCIGMATKFSGGYNVQPAAAAMKLHMPGTEALVNCGCRHLISIEAYHQLWDYSEVGSGTTYLKLNEVCTAVVCMFERGTSQDWELRLYFHQHAPLVYSRRVDSSPVSLYIGTQKTYVLLHEDCLAAYASAGELQMIIPDATVRPQSVASLSQLSIKLAYPNCESEYMTHSLSQFRFCPFEYLETLHNPALGTTKMLVPVHASLNSVVFLGMYCSVVRHESSTSNSASFSLKGSHYYLCPGGDMLGGSIISAIIASALLARKGFDRDAHFLFLGSSCSDSIMLIFEKFAWQIAWSPPSRGFVHVSNHSKCFSSVQVYMRADSFSLELWLPGVAELLGHNSELSITIIQLKPWPSWELSLWILTLPTEVVLCMDGLDNHCSCCLPKKICIAIANNLFWTDKCFQGGRGVIWHRQFSLGYNHQPFQGGRGVIALAGFLEQVRISPKCYFNFDKVHADSDYYLDDDDSFNLVQVYFDSGHQCDYGSTKECRVSWDPGGKGSASAWGQAEFQGGRIVSDHPRSLLGSHLYQGRRA